MEIFITLDGRKDLVEFGQFQMILMSFEGNLTNTL